MAEHAPYTPPPVGDFDRLDNGLYCRAEFTLTPENLEEYAAKLHNPSEMMEVYQRCVDFGWKPPYRSPEAMVRFCEKLHEEQQELLEAETNEEIVSEVGDVAWLLTASLHNLGGQCIYQAPQDTCIDEALTEECWQMFSEPTVAQTMMMNDAQAAGREAYAVAHAVLLRHLERTYLTPRGYTLADALEDNVRKLAKRVWNNAVDKNDPGQRQGSVT